MYWQASAIFSDLDVPIFLIVDRHCKYNNIAGVKFSVPSVALVVSRYSLRTFSEREHKGSVCALHVQRVGGHQSKTH